MQKEKNISDFSRDYLNTLLKTYKGELKVKEKTLISDVLNNAKKVERAFDRRYLVRNKVGKKGKGVEETKMRDYKYLKEFYSFL